MNDYLWQTAIIMGIGLLGCVVPMLPGPPLVWLGALYYAYQTNWQQVSIFTIVLLFVLAMAASTSNLWLSALGAKKTGASAWATLAAFVGGVIGLFVIGPLGLIVGAIAAIAAVEFARHRDWKRVLQASGGYITGFLLSLVVELLASILIIVWFLSAIYL